MLRIMIADDHPLIRIGLSRMLTQEHAQIAVEEVGSIFELWQALSKAVPDVLVLDLNMPPGNGLEIIPELRRTYPRLGILVLSVHPEHQAGVRAIVAGASGYLNKTSAPEQLLMAVRQVAMGKRYVSNELGTILADYVVRGESAKEPHENLSERELTVLLKISEGMTTAEIAESLQLSPKTIGTYRSRILEKMGITTTAELTRYVVEKGLKLEPPAARKAQA